MGYHRGLREVKPPPRCTPLEPGLFALNEPSPSAPPPASSGALVAQRGDVVDRLRDGRHPSSMVERPGAILTWIVSLLLASVVFARRCIDSLVDANQRGTVVYVMRSRSVIDYLYFNVAFRREGIPLARFANGVNTWYLRSLWQALRTLLGGRRRLPDDVTSFATLVAQDEATMLFLSRPRRAGGDDDSFILPYLERLIRAAPQLDRPVFLVPQLLVWDKRPDRTRPSLLDDVLGTRQDPGFIRRIMNVFQSVYEAFLQLGEPTVEVSSAIELHRFVARHPDETPEHLARRLRDRLRDGLESEQRVIVGPGVKPARQIRDEILADPRTRDAMLDASSDDPGSRTKLIKRARKQLKEIAADFNLFAIKVLSAILTPVWNRIYEGIEVDHEGLQRLREVSRDQRVVIVPSHKSHVDYLVMSYVLYRNGMIPPHIAAGVNLSFWPLGPIFRRSGAFFLRRSFAGDPLYPILFNAYLVKLLEEGFAIEFFIEGTRSRTGKLNPPKYGMLNMIVDAFRSGDVDRMAFVPVSVGYENIIEGSSYRKELTGGEKQSENLGSLISTAGVLRSRYGRVYVEFGEPVELGPFLERWHESARADVEDEDLARSVRRLAYRIIHGINDVTTATPSAIAAMVLLNSPTGRLDAETFRREAGFVVDCLRERHARMSRTLTEALAARQARLSRVARAEIDPDGFDDFDREFVEDANRRTGALQAFVDPDREIGEAISSVLDEAIGLLSDKRLVVVDFPEHAPRYRVPEDRRLELAFYRNNIIHYLVPEAVFATGLLGAGGPIVERNEVRDQVQLLSRLLKYEFCFEERSRFEGVFDDTAAWFSARGWLRDRGDGTWSVPTQRAAGAEFLRALLLPTLEGYALAAEVLADIGDDWIDEKALTRRAIQHGRDRQNDDALIHAESISRTTMDTAWRVYHEWGVLEQRREQRGRRSVKQFRVAPAERGEGVRALFARLDPLVTAQDRVSGASLSAEAPATGPDGEDVEGA